MIGIVVLSFYPITRKYYDERILPKVAKRDAEAEAAGSRAGLGAAVRRRPPFTPAGTPDPARP